MFDKERSPAKDIGTRQIKDNVYLILAMIIKGSASRSKL